MIGGRIGGALDGAGGSRVHGTLKRSVLLVLWLHANEHGEAWPSVSTLAEPFGADRRDVQKALRQLEAAGELVCVERGGGRGRSAR